MRNKHIYAIIISLFTLGLYAQFETYSYTDAIVNCNNSIVKRSTIYEASVKQQSISKNCYVMYDKNKAASINTQLASNPVLAESLIREHSRKSMETLKAIFQ